MTSNTTIPSGTTQISQAMLTAIGDVLESHDVFVGMSLTTFKSLNDDLSQTISSFFDDRLGQDGFAAPPIVKGDEQAATTPNEIIAVGDDLDIDPNLDQGDQTQTEYPATFTYDDQYGAMYYFSPVGRTRPPYLKQIVTKAIIDVASDGTLAGVDLDLGDIPPPKAKMTVETT